LNADGSGVVKETIQMEAREIIGDGEGLTMFPQGGHSVTGSIIIESEGGFQGLNVEILNVIQSEMWRAFTPGAESGTTKHFSIFINNNPNDLQVKESILPVNNDGPQKVQNGARNFKGGGMIGSGLLSIEDAEQMKEFFVSKVWPETKKFTAEILSNPQIQGSLYIIDGVGELFIGQALLVMGAPTIVGSAVGGIVFYHGIDQIQTGVKQLLTNTKHDSVTVVLLKEGGLSQSNAEFVHDLMGVGGSIGGAWVILNSRLGKEVFEKVIKEVGKEGHENAPKIFRTEVYPKDIKLSDRPDFKTDLELKNLVEKRILDGDYGNPEVVGIYEKISHEIPAGRIDYTKDFLQDLEKFKKGTSKLHHGPLKEDLCLVNYHNYDKEIGLGQGKRTISWATDIETGNKMPTIEDIHQDLALKHDWGKRDAVTFIKIPKGTDVTFISGKAEVQFSPKTGQKFEGGGFQVRFRDFDEKWIIETRKVK